MRSRIKLGIYLAGALPFVTYASCSTNVPADFAEPSSPTVVSTDEVLVRFRNLAPVDAVDVEFYATNEPLETVPDDLFHEEHLVTASIGIAGTGIIQPFHEDAVTFPCTIDLTVGTAGGRFAHNETGEAAGVGTIRWAQEEPLGLCGRVVSFEFFAQGEGFGTTLTVSGSVAQSGD